MDVYRHDVYRHMVSFAADVLRLSAWLVLLLIVFVPLERIFGDIVAPKRCSADPWARTCSITLNGILPKLLMIIPPSVLAAGLHRLRFPRVLLFRCGHAFVAPPAAALVVNEIGGYWGHRWSHEVPFLWRFHVIHHSAEEMDWLSSSPAHPVDLILHPLLCPGSSLRHRPGAAAGQPGRFRAHGRNRDHHVLGLFHPREPQLALRVLRVADLHPGFHHWHHTNDGPDVLNKNFAATFPWMDKCFGTLHLPKEWPQKYGSDTQAIRN